MLEQLYKSSYLKGLGCRGCNGENVLLRTQFILFTEAEELEEICISHSDPVDEVDDLSGGFCHHPPSSTIIPVVPTFSRNWQGVAKTKLLASTPQKPPIRTPERETTTTTRRSVIRPPNGATNFCNFHWQFTLNMGAATRPLAYIV
ncbi:hypothetical protein B0H10DRAFT_1946410 [Mycena sp. CBHHK59/15]|nr:hypothetical protein B0H10DRAFT_1946410 [Mycena sp. CBHHK59/15]